MTLTDILLILNLAAIVLIGFLVITLDTKMWMKIERVVNLIVLERNEIVKKIEVILTRLEEIEKRIEKTMKNKGKDSSQ